MGSRGISNDGGSALVRIVLVLVVIALVATAGLAYGAMGWQRMDAACTEDGAAPPDALGASVEFSWSWWPAGFTCTWPAEGGGDVEVTKLWW